MHRYKYRVRVVSRFKRWIKKFRRNRFYPGLWKRIKPRFGIKPKKQPIRVRRRRLSRFGKMLRMKQRIRGFYTTIKSQQFYRILGVAVRRGQISNSTSSQVGTLLESRIDSIIYRSNFIRSMRFGRQLINHGYVSVDGVIITRPSYNISINQTVNIFIEPNNKILRHQIRRGILTKRGKWRKFRRFMRRYRKQLRRIVRRFKIKKVKKVIRFLIKKKFRRIRRGKWISHQTYSKILAFRKKKNAWKQHTKMLKKTSQQKPEKNYAGSNNIIAPNFKKVLRKQQKYSSILIKNLKFKIKKIFQYNFLNKKLINIIVINDNNNKLINKYIDKHSNNKDITPNFNKKTIYNSVYHAKHKLEYTKLKRILKLIKIYAIAKFSRRMVRYKRMISIGGRRFKERRKKYFKKIKSLFPKRVFLKKHPNKQWWRDKKLRRLMRKAVKRRRRIRRMPYIPSIKFHMGRIKRNRFMKKKRIYYKRFINRFITVRKNIFRTRSSRKFFYKKNFIKRLNILQNKITAHPYINQLNHKANNFYSIKIEQKLRKISYNDISVIFKYTKEFNKASKLYPLIYKKIFKSYNKFKKNYKKYFYKLLLHKQYKERPTKSLPLCTPFVFKKHRNKFLFKINRKYKRLRTKYISIIQYLKIISNLLSIVKKIFTKLIKKTLLNSIDFKTFKQKKTIISKIFQPLKLNINLVSFKKKKKKSYKKNNIRQNYKKLSRRYRHKIHLRWNKKKYEKRSMYKKLFSRSKYTISVKSKKWNKKKRKLFKKYTKMFSKFKKFYKKEYKLFKKYTKNKKRKNNFIKYKQK